MRPTPVRDPGGWLRAKCLGNPAGVEEDSDPEARHFELVSLHSLILEYPSLSYLMETNMNRQESSFIVVGSWASYPTSELQFSHLTKLNGI